MHRRLERVRIAWLRRGLAALMMIACSWATAQTPLEPPPGTALASLAPHLAYYHEVSGAETLQVAMQRLQEGLLLSVALGYRYASLRNENERIAIQAQHELEQKVEQRTGELRNALGQLGDAHARLRESSQRDGLTGLHTRAYFGERFGELLANAREHNQSLSLLMLDLDNFKSINDRYGHLTGDECLCWAARTIGQALRPHNALLARFGGEEFIVALPRLDLAAAAAVAEQLRNDLRDAPCSSAGNDIRLTTSVEVHQVDVHAGGIDEALQRADEALYQAKADGRDCVRLASPTPAAAPTSEPVSG